MKKQIKIVLSFMLALLISINIIPTVAYANSAMPIQNSQGTGIVFELNDEIAVKSEVLDIEIIDEMAKITAIYNMINLTDKEISVESMFIAPYFAEESYGFVVEIDDEKVDYESKIFGEYSEFEIDENNWQYVIENSDIGSKYDNGIQTVKYNMNFEPNDEIEVMVSYDYIMSQDTASSDNMYKLLYYLTPANYWSDFTDLTINLTVDSDMPKIESSSVEFEKVGKNEYQYKADALPNDELEITVERRWYGYVWSVLTDGYLWDMIGVFILVLALPIGLIIDFVWQIRKRRKKKANR